MANSSCVVKVKETQTFILLVAAIFVTLFAHITPLCAQKPAPQDYLTQSEIDGALKGIAKKHHTTFIDMASVFGNEFSNGAGHGAQLPTIDVYMPDAWIAFERDTAKSQYLHYAPASGEPDTLRAMTVTAYGLATGTTSGPACDSVRRVALIAGKDSDAVEATSSNDVTKTWHNAFGASASCSVVTAKFMLSDVQRVQALAKDGDFIIGVFYTGGSSKLYKVKKQYRKDLGL
jgi:hypothetical protein